MASFDPNGVVHRHLGDKEDARGLRDGERKHRQA
jgi:hypothetical protein